ncbi:MAG TPA: metallophosphoesterase [Bacteroidales bacterium]|nr:metallophosphoesterase [Bacteroidales bacterium]
MNLSFHEMILLAYIIPNVYLFIRIWQLFISSGYKIQYTIIYLIVAAIFPISDILGRSNGSFVGEVSGDVSDYLLPFYLYLFLGVLLFDIFLLFNLIIKVLPADRRKNIIFRKRMLITLLGLSVIVVIGGAINFRTIRTTEYKIEVPARSSDIRHLRIAFAADFHIDTETDIGFIRRFVRKIHEISPDIMLYGGDIVEGHDGERMDEQEKLLKSINARYGVYSVLGNHEFYRGQDRGSFFEKAGIEILRDSVIVIDNLFSLAGRLDSHFRERKSVEELIQSTNDSLPVILLDHRPTELEQASNTSTDVQLSGHTHDGQMFPINIITRKVYLLSKGYLKIRNTHFFVTSGIRQWRFPVRTTGKSEIMVIDITFTRDRG